MKVGKKFNGGTIVVVLLLAISGTANAKTIYVAAGADQGGNGTSWQTAYKCLQDALHDPPTYGDEIWVAAGIYYPDEDESGNVDPNDRTASFGLINGVALYGGFPVGGDDWEERDPNIHVIVLSGDLAGNDGPVNDPMDLLDDPNRAENSYHVVTTSDTDPNTVLDGVTISGGNADGSYPHYYGGGGIYSYGYVNVAYATIANCIISGNSANSGGGLYSCHGMISNCTISSNSADEVGGGLTFCHGPITNCMISGNSSKYEGGGLGYYYGLIINCTISDNSAYENGGGFYGGDGSISNCMITSNSAESGAGIFSFNGTISNCIVIGNSARNYGGGVYGGSGIITNCLISGNSADNRGGGVCACHSAINNCTIIGNSANYSGGIRWCNGLISNCIIWDNLQSDGSSMFVSVPPIFSCVQDASNGVGCINTDPCFVEPGYWYDNDTPENESDDIWVEGDYRLKAGSPCIDVGNFYYHMKLPGADLDGNTRLFGPQIDMGCYEYGGTKDSDGDWLADNAEPVYFENPDRDIDGIFDGIEILGGSDPNIVNPLNEWIIPYDTSTIQEALFYCRAGEIIILVEETYNENLCIGGRNIILTSRDPSNPNVVANTVISGDTDGDTATASGRAVMLIGSESENCRIRGLTITAGSGVDEGGGIYSNFSRACITDCMITGNVASVGGGGISQHRGTIDHCTVNNNTSGYGGGLHSCWSIRNCTINRNSGTWGGGIRNCFGPITNCTIGQNIASMGGGIYNTGGAEIILNSCDIYANSADVGGGIYNNNMAFIATNCIIYGNHASSNGGAIYNYNSYNSRAPKLTNCTLEGNSALYGKAIAFESKEQSYPGISELTNCILWNGGDEVWNNDGSTINISYSDVQGGWPGEGNINVNPLFADPNNGDYHLKSQAGRWDPNSQSCVYDEVTSRCIDAGNPGMSIGDEYPDPENVRINMGAYGGTAEASRSPTNWSIIADTNNDGVVEMTDYSIVLSYFGQTGENLPGDFNHDGVVDLVDLAYLAENWLKTTIWYIP